MRSALIEVAEVLFAERGMNGVSLREIGKAAGSDNTGVVNYYFGGKQQLIEAVYAHRLAAIERRRAELLSEVGVTGDAEELRGLLLATFLPVFEQRDGHNRHSYAGFLASLGRSSWSPSGKGVSDLYPVSDELMARLQKFIPNNSRPLLEERMNLVTAMIVSAIEQIRATGTNTHEGNGQDLPFFDALTMAAAAITAPAIG